jgi:hypothetical protein
MILWPFTTHQAPGGIMTATTAIAARNARRANLRVRMERLVEAAGIAALDGITAAPRLRAIGEAYNRLDAERVELARTYRGPVMPPASAYADSDRRQAGDPDGPF